MIQVSFEPGASRVQGFTSPCLQGSDKPIPEKSNSYTRGQIHCAYVHKHPTKKANAHEKASIVQICDGREINVCKI